LHAVDAAVAPVIALVLPVVHAGLRPFTDRVAAPLPVLLAVFHPVGRVLAAITATVLP
jgi:hypothetical protein